MATHIGHNEMDLAICGVNDRQNLISSRVQSLSAPWVETDDGGWFLLTRRMVGSYWWGTDKALPTSEVVGVPQADRRWITLEDLEAELLAVEQEGRRLLADPELEEADDMLVEQLDDGARTARRHMRAAVSAFFVATGATATVGFVPFSRPQAPRASRRKRRATAARGSPRSSDPDEQEPPLGGSR